jgi:hypothetical protein
MQNKEKEAISKATLNATNWATRGATDMATRGATFWKTDWSTDRATRGATREATRGAIERAIKEHFDMIDAEKDLKRINDKVNLYMQEYSLYGDLDNITIGELIKIFSKYDKDDIIDVYTHFEEGNYGTVERDYFKVVKCQK